MEHLKFGESILNCSICRDSSLKKPKQYLKDFSQRMLQFWQHKYMPVTPVQSNNKLARNRALVEKHISLHRDRHEQKNRKILKESRKSHHKKKSPIIYQVYTLTTNDVDGKPIRKPSRIVYNYPFSSSSSETSTSVVDRPRPRKRTIKIHPSAKKGSDDEDTDSEYSTCHEFPISEKHYQHIVDGVKCPAHQRPSISIPKKKPKEERERDKITNSKLPNWYYPHQACPLRSKKKCNCKTKCKPNLEDDDDDGSDSQLSEKTFKKFINTLHTYVNKTTKLSSKKHQRYRLDTDSSCSLCQNQDTCNKKKRASKEHKHHHTTNHHQSTHKTKTKDTFKDYFLQ